MLQTILRYPNDVALDLLLQTPYLPIRQHDYKLRSYDQDSDPFCDWFASDEWVRNWYNAFPGEVLDLKCREFFGLSPEFMARVNRYKKDLLKEEARVLYVAVTRAKNAVVLSSGGSSKQSSPDFWSWKDEVMPTFRSRPPRLRLGNR